MNKDAYYQEGYERLLAECREIDAGQRISELEFLRQRAEQFGKMKILRYGNNIRITSCDAAKLAWFYKQTGNSSFRDKAVSLALYISGISEWLFQGKVDGYFNADLWTGDICANLSFMYDLIADELDENSRTIIEKSIITKGIEPIYAEWLAPETRKHALDTMGHNWWCVIVCGALVGVTALGERFDKGDRYFVEMLSGLKEWFGYKGNVLQNKKGNFGSEGDFIEFVGYLAYALSNYTLAEDMIRRKRPDISIFEKDKLEKLINYYMLFLETLENEVRVANFGDTPFSNTTNAHLFFYLSSRFNRPDLLKLFRRNYTRIKNIYDLVFYPESDIDSSEIKAPLYGIFNHSGYAAVRSGYTESDWFFAMKAGESWNHNHRDIGTFIISAKGREFIVDSGTCTYSKPQYQGYYTRPEAHNTVIFDEEGQHPDSIYCGTKFIGTFPSHLFTDVFKYLLCDGTGPLLNIFQRFYRHVMFFENIIFTTDDLHAYRPGIFTSMLHYKGNAVRIGNTTKIENNGEALEIHRLFPKNPTASTEKGYFAEIKENVNDEGILPESEYLKISSAGDDKNRIKFINAFILPYGEKPEITSDEQGEMLVTVISYSDRKYEIYCNKNADGRIMHFNGFGRYNDFYTDAFLTFVKYENGVQTALGMINGSFVRKSDEPLVSSLLKHDCYIDFKEKTAFHNVTANTSVYICGSAEKYALTAEKNFLKL